MPAKNSVVQKKAPAKKQSSVKKSVRIFWYVLIAGIGTFVLVILLAMLGAFGKLPSLQKLPSVGLPTLMFRLFRKDVFFILFQVQ